MKGYEYALALAECTIKNGELTTPYSGLDVKGLGDFLRVAVQKGEIPHTKVVAVKVGWGANTQGDLTLIKKTNAASRSYAELQGILQDVVFETGGGKAPNDFKWKGTVQTLGLREVWEKQIGHAMSICKHVTTGDGKSIVYVQEVDKRLRFLVDDVNIIDFTRDDAKISFVLKEGTGVVDFNNEVTQNIVESCRYFPVMQYYNLTPFLTVKRYREGETSVKFMYKRQIDEEVLQSILRKYGSNLS